MTEVFVALFAAVVLLIIRFNLEAKLLLENISFENWFNGIYEWLSSTEEVFLFKGDPLLPSYTI